MRVAVVTPSVPPETSGQTIVLYHLFRGWAPERYLFITHANYTETGAMASARLPAAVHRIDIWRRLAADALPIPADEREWTRVTLEVEFRAEQIERIAAAERCDLILATTGDLHDFPAARRAADRLGVPFVPYLFDSFVNQWQGSAIAARLEREAIAGAALAIVPNEFAAAEYRGRYGVRTEIVRNPVAFDGDGTPHDAAVRFEPGMRHLVFTGSVYRANAGALRNVARAVERLERDDVRLHVFSEQVQQLPDYGIAGPRVVAHAHLPHAAMATVQRQADVLVLPLGFDEELGEVLRTSAPGKTGEYLASGRPILAHVPEGSWVAWYFREHGCGAVVDRNDVDEVVACLNDLLTRSTREAVLSARRLAEEQFALQRVEPAFAALIATAIKPVRCTVEQPDKPDGPHTAPGAASTPIPGRREILTHQLAQRRREYAQSLARRGATVDPFVRLRALNRTLLALKRAVQDPTVEAMPSILALTNTQTCPLSCPFCWTHGSEAARQRYENRALDMPAATLERLADEAFPYAEQVLPSLVGEPLNVSFDALQRFVDRLAMYRLRLDLVTNASVLSPRRIQLLLGRCATVRFSFDGATESTFERIRRGANYRKTLRNIRLMTLAAAMLPRDLRPEFAFKLTLCGSNLPEFASVVQLAAVLGVGRVAANFVMLKPGQEELENERVPVRQAQYNRALAEARRAAVAYGVDLDAPPTFSPVDNTPAPQPVIAAIAEAPDHAVAESIARAFQVESHLRDEALELTSRVLERSTRELAGSPELLDRVWTLEADAEAALRAALSRHADALRRLAQTPEHVVPYCTFLGRFLEVHADGNSRQCCNGPETYTLHEAGFARATHDSEGDVVRSGVSTVFNGPLFAEYRARFDADIPEATCLSCQERVRATNRRLLDDITAAGAVRPDGCGAFVVAEPHGRERRKQG